MSPQRSAPDATVAALVGVGFAMALANTPLLWLMAVVTLVGAVLVYAVIRTGSRRHARTPRAQSAQTVHGARVLVLFVIAFLITRVTPPVEWRMAYAAVGGLIVGVGGYVVLRLEAIGPRHRAIDATREQDADAGGDEDVRRNPGPGGRINP